MVDPGLPALNPRCQIPNHPQDTVGNVYGVFLLFALMFIFFRKTCSKQNKRKRRDKHLPPYL